VTASFDEVTQIMNPARTRIRSPAGFVARSGVSPIAARPACASSRRSRTRRRGLGELIAFKEGEHWMLAVVRRMQRQQVDEVTVGAR
jgi:hypothetical protein